MLLAMRILVGIQLFVGLMLLSGTQGEDFLEGEEKAFIDPKGITKIEPQPGDQYTAPPAEGWPMYSGATTKPDKPLKAKHLVLFDINPQMDFCKGGALGSEGSDKVIEVMNIQRQAIAEFCSKINVIISLDTHTENHISFASAPCWSEKTVEVTNEKIEKNNRYRFRLMKDETTPLWKAKADSNQPEEIQVEDDGWLTLTLFDAHCVYGTQGHALHPRLIKENSKFFFNGMDDLRENYSPAPKYDESYFKRHSHYKTDSEEKKTIFEKNIIFEVGGFLRIKKHRNDGELIVIIRGFVYEYGVKSTAITLAKMDYKVYIVIDAISYFHPPRHSAREAADTQLLNYPDKILFVKSGDLKYMA